MIGASGWTRAGYHHGRVEGFHNSLRPKIRRYFERKPGWIKSDIRDMQGRLTDWQFLAKMGCSVPVWMRP